MGTGNVGKDEEKRDGRVLARLMAHMAKGVHRVGSESLRRGTRAAQRLEVQSKRAKYQSRFRPHRGKCEAEVKIERHTVRAVRERVRGAREGHHKHSQARGDNE